MTKIVLGSISKPGFLVDENGEYLISNQINPGQKYAGKVKFFASIDEGEKFIVAQNFFDLEPVELPVE